MLIVRMREVEGGLPARLVCASPSSSMRQSAERAASVLCAVCFYGVCMCVARCRREAWRLCRKDARGAQGMARTRQVDTWEQEKAALLETPAGIALAVPP